MGSKKGKTSKNPNKSDIFSHSHKKNSKFARATLQTGIVKRHPDGFGFFIPDDPEAVDVYIPRKHMQGVMANDRVTVSVTPEPRGDRFRGRIEEILDRGTSRATGQFHRLSDYEGLIKDHSFAWGADLIVTHAPEMNIKEGDWVSVRIDSFPDSDEGFRGFVIALIGDAHDPMNDSVRVLHAHSIPHEFSQACLKESAQFSDDPDEEDFKDRKDLRAIDFVTIDGKTAKDFDDAIYVATNKDGFQLFVAIADVSHYVKPGSAIDEDAYIRGTSTYFPSFVSPMLPEKLSNHLCSLRPHCPRLAFVCEMQLDYSGEILRSHFFEAVIESKARITYGEAQEVIDGSPPPELEAVSSVVLKAADLAKLLMAKRLKEGSLDMEIPETEVEVDEAGYPVDILQAERLFSHRLIEEMMLMANVAVARFFEEKSIPAIYRVHDAPKQEAIEDLEVFLQALGFQRKLSGKNLQKKISQALQEFADHPKQTILNILTLRSMAQAKYSSHNIGHFGLGFSHYSHFTSPIRRYPDLIAHRLIKALILPHRGYRLMSEEDLESATTFLSACEQRSVKAERQVQAIKKARFMSQFLGEEFEGSISSVTKFGVFVLLRKYDVDGLVRIEDLGPERFDFKEDTLALVAKKSGLTYSIGDLVTVQVSAVDVDQGRIDFILSGENQGDRSSEQKKQPSQKRGQTKNHRRSFRKTRVSKSR